MKYETWSKALGQRVFSRLDQTVETAVANSRNLAQLTGIDPDDLDVRVAPDQSISKELDRYGEEWHVDSDKVAAASNAKAPGMPA